MSFRLQITLHLDGGHASRAGRGHGLPIHAVLHVAGVKYARNIRPGAAFREYVSFRIRLDLSFEHGSVRNVPDGDEKAVQQSESTWPSHFSR